ncbi:MAG: hypothetical protein LBL95_07780 [Deltaproteobacteria bacterium]|jgi:hypothetical protein|nr:hypothetical protein [Deltaproteobacteria bacterium]
MAEERYDPDDVLEILKEFVDEAREFLPVVKAVLHDTDISGGLGVDDEVTLAIFVRGYGHMGAIKAEEELLFRTEGYDLSIAPSLYPASALSRNSYVREHILATGMEI